MPVPIACRAADWQHWGLFRKALATSAHAPVTSAPCVEVCGGDPLTKPYEFIRFGAMDVTKPYEFIRFVAMRVTKPYIIYGVWGHVRHQTISIYMA